MDEIAPEYDVIVLGTGKYCPALAACPFHLVGVASSTNAGTVDHVRRDASM